MLRGVLEDGTYDAFIVDVTTEGAVLHLDLTILAGAHKGEVISVRATGLDVDEVDAIGMPATVTVTDGEPSVVIDDV
jgi:hypothetical protein